MKTKRIKLTLPQRLLNKAEERAKSIGIDLPIYVVLCLIKELEASKKLKVTLDSEFITKRELNRKLYEETGIDFYLDLTEKKEKKKQLSDIAFLFEDKESEPDGNSAENTTETTDDEDDAPSDSNDLPFIC